MEKYSPQEYFSKLQNLLFVNKPSFDVAKLGFDPFIIASQIAKCLYTLARPIESLDEIPFDTSMFQGKPLLYVDAYLRDLTVPQREEITSIIHSIPFLFGFAAGERVRDDSYFTLMGVDDFLNPYECVIADWLATDKDTGRAIQSDPTFLQDKANLSYVTLHCYLAIRAFDTMNNTIFDDQCKCTLQGLMELQDNMQEFLSSEDSAFMKNVCNAMMLYSDLTKKNILIDASRIAMDKKNAAVAQLQSKNSMLEKRLDELGAVHKLNIKSAEDKVNHLEQQNHEKNEKIAELERQMSEKETELTRKLDEKETEVVMLRELIEQDRRFAETSDVREGTDDDETLDIQNMRVLLIGGHSNFCNKVHQHFPGWLVPGEEIVRIKPTKLDVILYNHLHCSHRMYAHGRQLAEATNAIEIYIDNINIEMLEEEIEKKLKSALLKV